MVKKNLKKLDIDYDITYLANELNIKEPTLINHIRNILKEVDQDISIFKIDINNNKQSKGVIDIKTKYGKDPLKYQRLYKFGAGYYPLLKLILAHYDIDPYFPKDANESEENQPDMDAIYKYLKNIHEGIENLPLHLRYEIIIDYNYINSIILKINIEIMKNKNSSFSKGVSKSKIYSDAQSPTISTIDIEKSQNLHRFLIEKLDENILNEFEYRKDFISDCKQMIDSETDIDFMRDSYNQYIYNTKITRTTRQVNSEHDNIINDDDYSGAELMLKITTAKLNLIAINANRKNLIYIFTHEICGLDEKYNLNYLENTSGEELDQIFEEYSNGLKKRLAHYEDKLSRLKK